LAALWTAAWCWFAFKGNSVFDAQDYLFLALVVAFPHFVRLDIFIVARAVRSGWGRLGLVVWGTGILLLPRIMDRPLSVWWDGGVLIPAGALALYLPAVIVLAARWVLRGFNLQQT